MKSKKIELGYGVVYIGTTILAIKTPENIVYPSDDSEAFMCASQEELDEFINENSLQE